MTPLKAGLLGALAGALTVLVLGGLVVWAVSALTPLQPPADQVAKYTQEAGAELVGRGPVWTDDVLLQAGMVVCGAPGPAGGVGQQDALQEAASVELNQFSSTTILHHANKRLCPAE